MGKPKGKNRTEYSEQVLQRALADVRNGLTKKAASKKYGIPRSTIQFRLGPKFKRPTKGRDTYLTIEEESKLVNWILDCSSKGFPRRKMDLQLSVRSFLNEHPRDVPFRNNMPGDHWYALFMKRHPELSERTTEGVTAASANVSKEDIRGWFTDVETYLRGKDYFSILSDKTRVFNADETNFHFFPKQGKVISSKGNKNVYETETENSKENLTVLFTFSASGDIVPPLVIYPYKKRIPRNIESTFPKNWSSDISENGWMKSEIFCRFLQNGFSEYLTNKRIHRPVILFVDGHRTHLTYDVSKLCSEIGIILIALYPNATRILQPADVSCFKPLKHYWKNAVAEWRKLNPFCKFTKEYFAPVLDRAVVSLKPKSIENGIRACGLQPWNFDAIDFSKCLGKKTSGHTNENLDDSIYINNNSFQNPSTLGSNGALSFESFVDIIGSSVYEDLQANIDSCNEQCKYFEALKRVFVSLKNDKTIVDEEKNNSELLSCTPNDLSNMSTTENNVAVLKFSETNVDDCLLATYFTPEELDRIPVFIEEIYSDDAIPSKNETQSCENVNLNDRLESIDERTDLVDDERIIDFWKSAETTVNEQAFVSDSTSQENISSSESAKIKIISDISLHENDLVSPRSAKAETKLTNSSLNIEHYLQKMRTPQRNSKRQSERLPYIVTSSGCKEILENKAKLKSEKEMRKANKEKTLMDKKTINARKLDSADAKMVRISTGINSTILATKVTNIEKQHHVRNLGFGEKSNIDSASTECKENVFEDNIVVRKGLCYFCAKSIYGTNLGIKCHKCSRTYHVICLQKNRVYAKFFLCNTCRRKL